MGTTLTGTTPQDTYDSLIKVTDNGPLSGSLKTLTDGLGNDSALALSTGAASITGTLAVSSTTTSAGLILSTNDAVSATDGSITKHSVIGLALKAVAASVFNFSVYSEDDNALIVNPTGTNNIGFLNGNVGIGTSSPSNKLDVVTTSGNSVIRLASPTTQGAFNFFTNGAGNAEFYVGVNNSAASLVGGIGGVYGAFVASYNARPIGFGIDGSERMRVTTNGLTFNGDTAAANALDDYEEGTWTMGISFAGNSVGVTYSGNTATYTKIGRQVTVNGFLSLSSKGSSVGGARITGLPFAIGSADSNYAAVSLRMYNITYVGTPTGYGVTSGTTIQLEELSEAGSLSVLTDADFANDSSIILSFTYFV